jgi:hypothetical protein
MFNSQKMVNGRLRALVSKTVEAAKREIHVRHLLHQLAALKERQERSGRGSER